MYHFLSLEDLR